jgi:hypothetical protein
VLALHDPSGSEVAADERALSPEERRKAEIQRDTAEAWGHTERENRQTFEYERDLFGDDDVLAELFRRAP